MLLPLEEARRKATSAVAPESPCACICCIENRIVPLPCSGKLRRRSPGLCWLKVDPRFDDLRDARFTSLLTRLRLNR